MEQKDITRELTEQEIFELCKKMHILKMKDGSILLITMGSEKGYQNLLGFIDTQIRNSNSNKGPNPVKLAARMHDFTDLKGAFISSKKKPSMRDKREIKDLNRCLKNSYVYDDTFFEVKKTESNFIVAQKR